MASTIPASFGGDKATFTWIAGHSSGTLGADATFHLDINGKRWVERPYVDAFSIDLRFHQQREHEDQHIGDHEPEHPAQYLEGPHQATAAPTQAKPFVDEVDHAFQSRDQSAEQVHDPLRQ